jgi:hypothetical protein
LHDARRANENAGYAVGVQPPGTALEDIPSDVLHRSVAERLEESRPQLATARMDAELHLGRDRYVVAELRQLHQRIVTADPMLDPPQWPWAV